MNATAIHFYVIVDTCTSVPDDIKQVCDYLVVVWVDSFEEHPLPGRVAVMLKAHYL